MAGFNYSFGAGGRGNADLIRAQAEKMGYRAEIMDAVLDGEDTVSSYFALRTIESKVVDGIPRLCLNGRPYFFHGLLDQGYWADGGMTPPDPACYECYLFQEKIFDGRQLICSSAKMLLLQKY